MKQVDSEYRAPVVPLGTASSAAMRLTQCKGKTAFTTFALARSVQQRSHRNGGGGRAYDFYRCRHCHLIHLGAQNRRPALPKPKRRYSEESET